MRMPRLRDEASPVRMSPAISTSPEEDLAQNRSLGEKPGWVGGLVLSNLLFEVPPGKISADAHAHVRYQSLQG